MNKKIIGLLLISIVLVLISNVAANNWIIEGNTVCTDNETWGELCMNPHTLYGPGYAYCNATMAEDYGNIDFVWGFNTSLERPRSIDLYNPHWDNTSSTQFFQNVSNIVVCENVCEIGHEYNDIKRNVTYERCSEWNETTMECETYEQVMQTVCFDSYEQNGNNYTVTWHTARMKYWTDKTHLIESVNYNWNGMNKWYYIKDISMPADVTKTVRIWIDMPVSFGSGEDTKFFFAAKRTTDTIQEAIAADRFMALDPWHNASRSHRKTVNVTHVNVSGSNLVNYTVFLNVSKETEMQSDFDDILFYETDGTVMNFEYENHTASYGLFWVLVPSLTAASDTQFWMYYGNDAATSSSNPESSWNVNCSMVQHLQEAPANDTAGHLDSTSNDNDGTPKNFDGTPTSTTGGTGIVDGADVFDGTDDYIDCGNSGGFRSTHGSIEIWFKSATTTWDDIFSFVKTKFSDELYIQTHAWDSGNIKVYQEINNVMVTSFTTTGSMNIDSWNHLIITQDGTGVKVYLNNVLKSITGTNSGNWISAYDSGGVDIGGRANDGDFNGKIDQVRIYNLALSADEINQSYQLVENQTTFVTWGSAEQQSEDTILHIGNAINIKDDWGRDFNSNFSANVTGANASEVWMNFTNAEFSNTSLGWLNLTLGKWANESHNINSHVTNVSVTVTLNSTTSGATNDTDSFYYEITNRTNTAMMDSAATQNANTSETFYVNGTCNEEYGDTFLGAANLLEDGAIVATDSSVTDYVNFSHSEAVAGVYNYTVRFYNLTHYNNVTTPTYSNVTVSDAEYIPPDPNNPQNTTGNFWVNHTWTKGLGEPTGNQTDSFNVSINLVWYNTTIVMFYNNSGLSAHEWSNMSVWAYNISGSGSLSHGSTSEDVQIPNNVPVLSGLPDNTTDEDVNQTDIFDLGDYFTDTDSDTPTYLVESNNQSTNVTVTINASNNVSYTLASGWNGTASVVINVTDGWGGEDNDTFLIIVNVPPGPGDYIPGNPTTLGNTTGNYWVNYTWNVGGGNVTDSYNVSWNLTWYNDTSVTYMNDSVGVGNWANITVYAFNSSGSAALSTGYVSDEVQMPLPYPVITLLSQYPSILYQNSTGYFNVSYMIHHSSSGLNNSSVSFVYTSYDTDNGRYNWSLRTPANNRSEICTNMNGERILRADNRNNTLNFENNATITGGNVYEWGGGDENVSRMSIVPVNSTHTMIHWNGTITDTVSMSMWYLDRTSQQTATMTTYDIYKNHRLCYDIWDMEAINEHTDYLLSAYLDTHLSGASPNKPNLVYYCNSSYDPEGVVNPEDSTNCFYVTSHNATTWVDYKYNNTYIKLFTVNQSTINASVLTSKKAHICFNTEESHGKPYSVNITNSVSTTNRTFGETNTTRIGGDAPLTENLYTTNAFMSYSHVAHQHQMKLFAADNNDKWSNSSLKTTDIEFAYYPPTTPVTKYFYFDGAKDYDMNNTYNGTFDINVLVGTDPDGGETHHNLTLHYGNQTFVAIINDSFYDVNTTNCCINILFDSSSYYSSVDNYTLKIVATDDESKTSQSWLGVNFSLIVAGEDYIPPNPTSLANTTGNGWVNYTWDAGTPGNITNSYNVSWNSTWYNTTLTTYMNDTIGAFEWANITIWAYNSSGNGSLSNGNVTDDTRAGGGTFVTNMNTGVWNLISFYNATNGTAEEFGIDIGNVDYVSKYNGSFYTHSMGYIGYNFTTVHGMSYFVFLNASGSATYTRNTIPDISYNTSIYNRWNTIGWTNATSTNAAGLITSINSTDCKYICKLNADGITNTVYSKGFVTNNYAINRGYGYWAWNSNDTVWGKNS